MERTVEEDFRITPLFREALRNFQLGNWEVGFEMLNELEASYPLEREIRALRHEMQIRAKIDQDERQDIRAQRRKTILTWATRVGAAWLLAGLVFWGYLTYSSWIQSQLTATQSRLESEVQSLDMTVRFNNARNLLQAGRPEEAKALLILIAQEKPDYPDLQRLIDEANSQIQLQADYEEAIRLVQAGEVAAARARLEDIQARSPNYKDVPLQLQYLTRASTLEETLVRAELAFAENRWEDAITEYETLRATDASYQAALVEERLYNSYIKAAEASLENPVETLEALERAEDYFGKALQLRPLDSEILARRAEARKNIEDRLVTSYLTAAQSALVGQADSLKALQKAESYLNKALALRPGDKEIYRQHEMAVSYLEAVDAFGKGAYDEVIEKLEMVCTEDPGYADGTARQTLYEAYTSRGNNRLASGDFELALTDFQQAAILAQQSPDSILRLFEAQLLVADTQGLLGNYVESVRIYQAALEISGLGRFARDQKLDLTAALDRAEKYASRGDYKNAYQVYSGALHDIGEVYRMENVVVASGDYLTMLARRYNTTVSAILTVNGMSRASEIKANMILKIPTLP